MESIQTAIALLKQHSIRLVVFDMDQTAVAMHSRGQLRRTDLRDYLEHATPDFRQLVPALHQNGFFLAIATHSDAAEFSENKLDQNGCLVQPETHILGEELVRALLLYHFPQEMANSFGIVAYHPRVHAMGDQPAHRFKRRHMTQLLQQFQVSPEHVLFFDDEPANVVDCNHTCHVKSVQVDSQHGFRLSDLLNALSEGN